MNKSDLLVVRVLFVAALGAAAAMLDPFSLSLPGAAGIGVVAGLAGVFVEVRLRRVGLKQILGGSAGILTGGLVGFLLVALLHQSPFLSSRSVSFLQFVVPLIAGYVGLLIGTTKAEALNLNAVGIFGSEPVTANTVKLLDTSVIIDGRIGDIAESGFLDGTLAIPQFVLRELQVIADSADSAKRNRGRRGLDVLQRLQKMPGVDVQLVDDDPAHVREVDLKLIELAKLRGCKIMTNDFNLNKVAQVHGVEVLNINELANALKPVVLPGEIMRVFILKEGKEYNQGVAYLDDGTMVVVDNARRQISRTVDVTVTSVLQTTAGKMIFGKYEERGDRTNHPSPERNAAIASSAGTPQIQNPVAKEPHAV